MGGYKVGKLYLNAAPFLLSDDQVLYLYSVKYKDHETLRSLRNDLRDKYFVRRSGDNVEIVPYVFTNQEKRFGNAIEINLYDRYDLLCALTENWILRTFKSKKATCWVSGGYIHYLSKKAGSDILDKCLSDRSIVPTSISLRFGAEFSIRKIQVNGKISPSVIANTRKRIIINEPIINFLQKGFDPIGFYVLEKSHPEEKGKLVGCVDRVEGEIIFLKDNGNNPDTLKIHSAYLEPRQENLEKILKLYLGDESIHVLEKIKNISSDKFSGPSKLDTINQLFSFLDKQEKNICQNIEIQFDSFLINECQATIQNGEFTKPNLLFDVSGRKTTTWNQGGLDKYGPFNWEGFPYRNINIAVICQSDKQGDVEEFIGKFLYGIPGSKYAESGFLKRYHFDKPYFRVFPTENNSPHAYKTACGKALDHITEHGRKWHLSLIQIEESFHDLHGTDNPYLVVKAFLLSKDIPVQQFEFETIIQNGVSLAASVNNMGVACYAKMGGTPWILPTKSKLSHELIIGIGSYMASEGRLGDKRRYIGVTTVFSGDGRYLLESRTAVVDFDSYQKELASNLVRVVNDIKRTDAWNDNDPVRFIFHIFKPLKNSEIEAVKQLVAELGMPHADFAFLHIADSHPFYIFDKSEPGIGSQVKKGVYAPSRGNYIKLNSVEALVCLTGAKELKQVSDGLPTPICLKLHESSSFRDLDYLSRQVFEFSCLSWRGLQPSPVPITILYSDLIAKNINQLSTIPSWSTENILGPIGRTRWFL
jgi:hypothetical protein